MNCVICGEKAKWRYSPDLDIQGLGACSKHKLDVQIGYFILMSQGEIEYREYMKDFKK